MRGISLLKFLVVTVVIGALASVAYFGTTIFNNTIGAKGVRQGLDVKGGSYIVFQPQVNKELSPQQWKNDLDSAKQVIRNRLSNKGIFDANVTADPQSKRLIVEIPGETNTQKAEDEIGKTAKLQFVGPNGEVIAEGNDIVNAQSEKSTDQMTGQSKWVVTLEFSAKAATKFADATERIAKLAPQGNNFIAILLDGKPTSNELPPRVSNRIDGGRAEISGGDFTQKSTEELAALIRSGSLPFSLKAVQSEGIGPTLGQQALKVSIEAGMVAFAIICAFMLVLYRLPGIVAAISLISYVSLTVIILSAVKIPLTLPGIAGIILSVGMAVDANIIIYERVKEELRSGKTLRGAVELGFKRAFSTILDANITTVIVGVVLYALGTGPIQGFAVTLTLGVILSFFSAITLTRFLLIQIMGLGLRQTWLYGYKGGKINA